MRPAEVHSPLTLLRRNARTSPRISGLGECKWSSKFPRREGGEALLDNFYSRDGISSSENEGKVGCARSGCWGRRMTLYGKVKLSRMNDGVRKEQRKVERANHLLEKERIRWTSYYEREASLCQESQIGQLWLHYKHLSLLAAMLPDSLAPGSFWPRLLFGLWASNCGLFPLTESASPATSPQAQIYNTPRLTVFPPQHGEWTTIVANLAGGVKAARPSSKWGLPLASPVSAKEPVIHSSIVLYLPHISYQSPDSAELAHSLRVITFPHSYLCGHWDLKSTEPRVSRLSSLLSYPSNNPLFQTPASLGLLTRIRQDLLRSPQPTPTHANTQVHFALAVNYLLYWKSTHI